MRKHNKYEVKKKNCCFVRTTELYSTSMKFFTCIAKYRITFIEINLIKFFSCFVNFKISYIFIPLF